MQLSTVLSGQKTVHFQSQDYQLAGLLFAPDNFSSEQIEQLVSGNTEKGVLLSEGGGSK